jgi:hypothetical protein
MTRLDPHLVKPLVEIFSNLSIFCFLILSKDVNPGLEDYIWKQSQACYVVYLTNKTLSIAWIIYIYIRHDADVLQDTN